VGAKTDLPTGTPIPLVGMTPTVEIIPGTEVIDGIPFVFVKVTGGEVHTTLVIKLPEQGVLVAQDVVYNRTHLWFLDKDFDGCQANIDRFAAQTAYDTVLPGHGEPTTPAVWVELTDYVNAGRELLRDDGDAYKKAVTERYPSRLPGRRAHRCRQRLHVRPKKTDPPSGRRRPPARLPE
jgi:hypothetical protein